MNKIFFCIFLLIPNFLYAEAEASKDISVLNTSNGTETRLNTGSAANINITEGDNLKVSLTKLENNLKIMQDKFLQYDKSLDRFLDVQKDTFNKIIIVLLSITALLIGASAFNNVYLIRHSISEAEKNIRREFEDQIKIIKGEIKEVNEINFKKIEEEHSAKFRKLEEKNAEASIRIDEATKRLRTEFTEQINNVQAKINESTEDRFKKSEEGYSKEFQHLQALNNNALGRIYHENKSYFISSLWYARGLKGFIESGLSDDEWIKLQIKNVISNLKLSARIKDPEDIVELQEVIKSIPEKDFKNEKDALKKSFEENISKVT